MARRIRFKMLVDQATSQIVWLTHASNVYIPNIDPSLNPISFSTVSELLDKDIWEHFSKYRLFCGDSDLIINSDIDKNSAEYKRIRLLRAKAISAEFINTWINFKYQSHDFTNTKFYDSLRSDKKEQWVNFFQIEYKCSELQAIELIKFKLDEYDTFVFTMESTKLYFVNLIKGSRTEDELQNILSMCAMRLLHSSVPLLKELPSITGE